MIGDLGTHDTLVVIGMIVFWSLPLIALFWLVRRMKRVRREQPPSSTDSDDTK
jgi:hypothetical protein